MTPREAILRVLEALKLAKTPFMITGALASNHYGVERSTKDADIVLETALGDFPNFIRELGQELMIDPQVTFETITGSYRHIVELRGTPFKIELFLLGKDPHHQERFARRRTVRLSGLGAETWIPTAEDVIIQKVRWGRLKDLDDALNVLAVQGDKLDFAYIERWCRVHGTLERLDELRRSIPPI
jgi:hypothetical protein